MKTFFVLALLASGAANAASVTLPSTDASKIVEALMLSGVKPNTSKSIYTLSLANLECKSWNVSHAEDPSDVRWGFEIHECTKPAVKGATAKILFDSLDALTAKYDGIQLTDCAMGKCYIRLKRVSCTINSAEPDTDKRFACTLVDTE